MIRKYYKLLHLILYIECYKLRIKLLTISIEYNII
nr:MAG TPA: hypothetical protein [Caudoviricetes sp.]